MPKVSTYLSFDGTAAKAMRFYEKALGAKLDMLRRFADTPNAAQMPKAAADKVLPLQPSFFAETFGMLIDRFGTPWSVSGGTRQG